MKEQRMALRVQQRAVSFRWRMALLLSMAAAINYLDRQTLSVLATTIQQELRLTDVDYSFITSAFLFSYTAMYFVSGYLTDRFGTKRILSWSVGGWSIATVLHAAANTALQFSGVRMVLGIFESANFPAGIKAVTEWFPVKERALAVGIFNAGASVGGALAVPLVSVLALNLGWRYAFVLIGALGLIWLLFWRQLYHLPAAHSNISEEERRHILGDQLNGNSANEKNVGYKKLLRVPQVWACLFARILIDPVTYFLIFWIPKYLQTEQGFNLRTLGYFAWLPYLALSAGTVMGGGIPLALVRKGWSLHKARMTMMVAASVSIPLCYFLLTGTTTATLAVALIAGLMFFHGLWSNITLPTEVLPKSVQGTVTGLGGTLGGLAGIGTQLIIGRLVQSGTYTPVLLAAGLTYGVALLIIFFTVKKIGTIVRLE